MLEGFIIGVIENRIQNYLSNEELDSETKGKIIKELKHIKGELKKKTQRKIIVHFKNGEALDFLTDNIEVMNNFIVIESDRTMYFNIDNITRIEEVEYDK